MLDSVLSLKLAKQVKNSFQKISRHRENKENEKVHNFVKRFRQFFTFIRRSRSPRLLSSTLKMGRLKRLDIRHHSDALGAALAEQDPSAHSNTLWISDEPELDRGRLAAFHPVLRCYLLDDGGLSNVTDVDGGAEPGQDLLRVIEHTDARCEGHGDVAGFI